MKSTCSHHGDDIEAAVFSNRVSLRDSFKALRDLYGYHRRDAGLRL